MRIRSIKPEFWRSDDITALPIEDRLLFIGLWSYVDDNGVGRDKLADICADLFAHDLSVSPHDTLMRVAGGLKRLFAGGLIVRYSVENRPFLYVKEWSAHQKINRPSPGRYPSPTSNDAEISESSVSAHGIVSEASLPGAVEQRSRGTGEQGMKDSPEPAASGMPDDSSSEYPEAFEEFWAQYPRKAGKRKALTAWLRARKRAPESAILDGAIRYAQDVNREEQFTKYPEGWLNADMWLDDPLPARTGPTPPVVSKSDAKVLGYLERGQRLADAARRNARKEIS